MLLHTGVQYCFTNTTKDGWISRADRQGVLLRHPRLAKRDDTEPLLAEFVEVQQQLAGNQHLTESDRQRLLHRLHILQARLDACGLVLS
jgi:2-oxo-4-hydroxy-4-carboxy--5-ureidoimidazoline (OHCU) decarboxylase